jgi:sigma-B regulation protein RsbU (phosphoserine phosphatase)
VPLPAAEQRFDPSRLESLLESARLLNASLELDEMLRHLLRTVMGRLLAARGVIAIAQDRAMVIRLARGLPALPPGSCFDQTVAASVGLNAVYPIGDGLGLLALAISAARGLAPAEEEFLQALLGLAATSIANARAHEQTVHANRSLDQKNQELRALLDLGRGLAATTEPEQIAQMLTLTLAGRWGARKQAVITWKPNQPPLVRAKGMTAPPVDLLRPAVEKIAEAHAQAGSLVPEAAILFPIRSGEETTGVVLCGPRMGGAAYAAADVEFGAGLVAQASVAFENAWHFRETLEKKKIEQELEVAAGIQRDLFPKQLPALANTELAARNRQARQVGGDYYDVLPYGEKGPEHPHLLCVADISGKGVSASLLMANIQATLRAVLAHDTELPALAARTSDLLWASTPPNKYATAILVRYDPATGAGVYVNGGHADGVILKADDTVELLPTTGLPVGLFPKRTFEQASFQLQAGDVMVLYSDGVSEANDLDQNEFGMDRLVASIRATRGEPAAAIIDRIIADIDAFAGAAPQFDDITLMVVKRR